MSEEYILKRAIRTMHAAVRSAARTQVQAMGREPHAPKLPQARNSKTKISRMQSTNAQQVNTPNNK
jgi:hypothetical protein